MSQTTDDYYNKFLSAQIFWNIYHGIEQNDAETVCFILKTYKNAIDPEDYMFLIGKAMETPEHVHIAKLMFFAKPRNIVITKKRDLTGLSLKKKKSFWQYRRSVRK